MTFLIVSSLPNYMIYESAANPIAIYMEQSFGYLILDSNISMPEALVNFSIEPTPSGGAWISYDIRMNATYTFLSTQTRLATIGLACPNNWASNESEIQILDNGVMLPYVILHYDYLMGCSIPRVSCSNKVLEREPIFCSVVSEVHQSYDICGHTSLKRTVECDKI